MSKMDRNEKIMTLGNIEVEQRGRETGSEYVSGALKRYDDRIRALNAQPVLTQDEVQRLEDLRSRLRYYNKNYYREVRSQDREYNKKPRLYVWHEDSTVLEHLENRKQRPYQIWKTDVVQPVLDALGMGDVKARWSQRAGCSCPCSPGFILDTPGHFDIYVTVKGTTPKTQFEAARQDTPELGWLMTEEA